MIPPIITSFLEKVGLDKFFLYINDNLSFIYSPVKSINQFYQFKKEELYDRLFAPLAISYGILYLLFELTIYTTTKYLLISILISIYFLLINSLTFKIINKTWDIKANIVSLFPFVTIFSPCYIYLHYFFINTELYIFYFSQGCILFISIFYSIILPFIIWPKKIIKRISAIIINLIFYNLCFGALFFTDIFELDKIYLTKDPIIIEYQELTNKLELIEEIPLERKIIVDNKKSTYYIYNIRKLFDDNLTTDISKQNSYKRIIDSEILKTRELLETPIKFKRNYNIIKEYNQFLNLVKDEIDFEYESIPDTLDVKVYLLSDSSIAYLEYYEVLKNQNYLNPFFNYIEGNNNLMKFHEISEYSYRISIIYLLPCALYFTLEEYINGSTIIIRKKGQDLKLKRF